VIFTYFQPLVTWNFRNHCNMTMLNILMPRKPFILKLKTIVLLNNFQDSLMNTKVSLFEIENF